jgi:hypothetical protein
LTTVVVEPQDDSGEVVIVGIGPPNWSSGSGGVGPSGGFCQLAAPAFVAESRRKASRRDQTAVTPAL